MNNKYLDKTIYGTVQAYLNAEDGAAEKTEEALEKLISTMDENGMLLNKGNALSVELANRFWISVLLNRGYNGPQKEALENLLEKAALPTLYMQSVTGTAPYGGAFAEYVLNEFYLAGLCEFMAQMAKRRGDVEFAGQLKRAAVIAYENGKAWTMGESARGVKNHYPTDSAFGLERHVTSDAILATIREVEKEMEALTDDSIEPGTCPAEAGGYVWKTSPAFHKIFLNSGEYSAEMDSAADFSYDANGLGRLMKKGAPEALCLAHPFTTAPQYGVNSDNIFAAGICAAIESDEGFVMSAEEGTHFEILSSIANEDGVGIESRIRFRNGALARESLFMTKKECTLKLTREKNALRSDDGNDIAIMLPAFLFDGKNYSEVALHDRDASVTYAGWKLFYETNKSLVDTAITLTNRNGHYRMFMAAGAKTVQVKIRMEKA